MNRFARSSGLVLLGLLVGAVAGAYFGSTYVGKPMRALSALGTVAWAGNLAQVQYEHAGYVEAREAQEHYIAVLRDAASHPELELTRTAHFDIGLAYTRLAILAEANGKPEEAAGFMARAVEEARAGGWKDPSPERLRAFVERLGHPYSAKAAPGA